MLKPVSRGELCSKGSFPKFVGGSLPTGVCLEEESFKAKVPSHPCAAVKLESPLPTHGNMVVFSAS